MLSSDLDKQGQYKPSDVDFRNLLLIWLVVNIVTVINILRLTSDLF